MMTVRQQNQVSNTDQEIAEMLGKKQRGWMGQSFDGIPHEIGKTSESVLSRMQPLEAGWYRAIHLPSIRPSEMKTHDKVF